MVKYVKDPDLDKFPTKAVSNFTEYDASDLQTYAANTDGWAWDSGEGVLKLARQNHPKAIHRYDAAEISGLSDGDTVSTWNDQVGSSDASALGAPTYRTNAINGKASVEFDGTDDAHETTYQPNTDNNLTGMAVYLVDSTKDQNVFGQEDANLASRFTYRLSSAPEYTPAYGDGSNSRDSYSTATKYLGTLRAKNGTANLRIDGTQTLSFSYTSGGQSDEEIHIGARVRGDKSGDPIQGFLDGKIGEVIFYKGLTDSERDSEEQRIADKWGITI